MKLHASGEDYLEIILVLQKKLGMVRSVDVARHMEVTKPSVCHAVATLRDGGFLTMDEDHFLHLTDVGREVAEKMLHDNGIYDVKVTATQGHLTDHYNPATKTVNLSESVYNSNSVSAAAVAAHECGHAVQHNTDYVPLKVRSAIVPAANLGSQLFWPLFLIGLIFSLPMLVKAGIWLFVLALAFQVVTLPVEFDASRRALKMLSEGGMVTETEHDGVKKVLWAAAMTYVAAVIGSLLQLLRLPKLRLVKEKKCFLRWKVNSS